VTEALYRNDSYLKSCTTRVTAIAEEGVQVAESVFYPHGGGQLGDTGVIVNATGNRITVLNTVKSADGSAQWLQIENENTLQIGDAVTLELDWDRRFRLMRFHSGLHLLCAAVNAPVNGGSIQEDRARLDFDLPEGLDKAAVQEKLDAFIAQDVPVSTRWITNEELAAQPELVRTMAVAPPKNASGTIRLVEFKGIDLQACGGTHVASSGEVGAIRVAKIENKGRQNRRVTIKFIE